MYTGQYSVACSFSLNTQQKYQQDCPKKKQTNKQLPCKSRREGADASNTLSFANGLTPEVGLSFAKPSDSDRVQLSHSLVRSKLRPRPGNRPGPPLPSLTAHGKRALETIDAPTSPSPATAGGRRPLQSYGIRDQSTQECPKCQQEQYYRGNK